MRFEPTGIDGAVVIRLDLREDARGGFARTFCEEEMDVAGMPFRVRQTNLSRNPHLHTLRGLHFQHAPHGEAKIVSCPRGRIWDVAVDLRAGSPTYRQWRGIELSPDTDCAFHLAEGLAHGFLTLEPDSEVHYLMGAPYVAGTATGVRWNDPSIGIVWPAMPAVMSDADRGHALLNTAQ